MKKTFKKGTPEKGLKRFATQALKEDKPCEICWKPAKQLCSMSFRTWDTTRHYVRSGRPMVGTYKIKACPKCFLEMMKAVDDAIEKVCKSKV